MALSQDVPVLGSPQRGLAIALTVLGMHVVERYAPDETPNSRVTKALAFHGCCRQLEDAQIT